MTFGHPYSRGWVVFKSINSLFSIGSCTPGGFIITEMIQASSNHRGSTALRHGELQQITEFIAPAAWPCGFVSENWTGKPIQDDLPRKLQARFPIEISLGVGNSISKHIYIYSIFSNIFQRYFAKMGFTCCFPLISRTISVPRFNSSWPLCCVAAVLSGAELGELRDMTLLWP